MQLITHFKTRPEFKHLRRCWSLPGHGCILLTCLRLPLLRELLLMNLLGLLAHWPLASFSRELYTGTYPPKTVYDIFLRSLYKVPCGNGPPAALVPYVSRLLLDHIRELPHLGQCTSENYLPPVVGKSGCLTDPFGIHNSFPISLNLSLTSEQARTA